MSVEALYQQVILDHARERHGHGLREPFDAQSHQVNPTCGDEVTLRVQVRGGRVGDVSWDGEGCSISQASTSVMCDLVVGADVPSARHVTEAFGALMRSRGGAADPDGADEGVLGDAIAFAGVSRYPARIKCALLGWMALTDALNRSTTEEYR